MKASWLKPAATPAHRFSPHTKPAADALLGDTPAKVLRRLLAEREDEVSWLLAKRIADAALGGALLPFETIAVGNTTLTAIEAISTRLASTRALIGAAAETHPAAQQRSLLQYGYCATLGGSWLRTVSQPATQPAAVVNRLFSQYFLMMGEGQRERSDVARWQRYLAGQGLRVPEPAHTAQWETIGVSQNTFLICCILQSFGYYGCTYLPEIVGLHWAWKALDTAAAFQAPGDDGLMASHARETCEAYLSEWENDPDQADAARVRVARGAALAIALRRLQLDDLDQCAAEAEGPLDHKVAAIFKRHYQFAGPQHGNVKVNGQRLVDLFNSADFDPLAFVRQFRESHWTAAKLGQPCRFLSAIRFGGPMFGVFNAEETQLIQRWLEEPVQAPPSLATVRPAATLAPVLQHPARDIEFCAAVPQHDERELFYRLVNIEQFPHLLAQAKSSSSHTLRLASHIPWDSTRTRYTDASTLEWSTVGLQDRVLAIYRNKLLAPCRPLEKMPSRDEVIFRQKTYFLGNLIDGAWLHRLDPVTAQVPGSWEMFAIYADEMGCGKQEENHITLMYEVMDSMDISLPHIASKEFCDQDELLDDFYPFVIFQLSLALFPKSAFRAMLGYNLAIEMFGLGEMRQHEIEKLRHWKFSTLYEVTHLSIDNLSGGHASLAVDAIIGFMRHVEEYVDEHAAEAAFAAIWAGYASFAHFIEAKDSVSAAQKEYIV